MGGCDSIERPRPEDQLNNYNNIKMIESREINIDSTQFYDVVVPIQSIKDITNGIEIKTSQRFKTGYEKLMNEKSLKIGIIGNSNKGKSFILSKLSKIRLPSGTSIKTEGLSIKYPDLRDFPNRKIVLLDSAGLETPVLLTNKNNNKMITNQNNYYENGNKIEEENNVNIFKEKSKEKIITELFLQDYIIYNSDILIVVVGILTYSEQKILNKIKTKLKREKSLTKSNNNLFIIHNLMTYTTVEQVENYINQTLLKSATFELEKNIKINTKNEESKGVCFYEKNSYPKIFHLIFANEYSQAGYYYNQSTLEFIENYYDSITDLKGFNIIETIKERFKEESKDFIEIPPNENVEFFDNSKTTIKLRSPKILTLKKFFIDELGFQNMKANGFEPNYNYYKTTNSIIIKIEIPGNFYLETSYQYGGEYTLIKINGKKIRDGNVEFENFNICDRREYGSFSLDIPIKQEGFVIKNEKPRISSQNGIITLIYKIEKVINPVPFGPEQNHS